MSAWPLREWPSGENYPFFDGGSGDEDVGKTCPAFCVITLVRMIQAVMIAAIRRELSVL